MTIETKNKVYGGIAVLILLLGLGSVVRSATLGYLINVEQATINVSGQGRVQVEGQNIGSAQTTPTYLTDPDTLSSQDSLYVWGTGTGQGLEVAGTANLRGTTNLRGATSLSGDTRAASFVQTGALATFTVTSTATAADVCDSRHWIVTPNTTTPTITLPNTTTLFADCMTTNGDVLELSVETVTTSTVLAVGAGGNADLSSTLTITANKSAILRFIRNSATTYLLMVINANS